MRYTSYQKKIMNYLGLSKVVYNNMWIKDHQLGYVSPDSPLDRIHIAKDFPDGDVKRIALLHECGHVYFAHTSVDTKKELKDIKEIFKELDRDFSLITLMYGGPMSFLNIAMDLEVNSKLLTLANVKHINSFVKICTPDAYDIPVMNNFREYYRPLIEKLPEGKVEMIGVGAGNLFQSDNGDGTPQDPQDNNSGNSMSGSGKGNGKGSPSDSSNGDSQGSSKGKQNLPQLSKGLEDIMNGVSGFDSDLDDELQKELRKEGYQSGNDKEDGDSNSNGKESTVDKEVDKADEEEDLKESGDGSGHRSNKGIGSDHSITGSVKVVENSSKEIMNFLSQILKPSMVYQQDAFKHYNRGTRRNSNGLLYNSVRRRNRMDKKKLGVLIDVSGSMDTDSIIKALSSLKDSLSVVSSDSVVVTWDTEKCEEFPITKLPSSVRCGGGTDMFRGLKYLVKEKDCNEVVIYSDFYTDIEPMTKIIKKEGTGVYNIRVVDSNFDVKSDDFSVSDEYIDYFKVCKESLIVKSKR